MALSGLNFKGTWNAVTNTNPTLTDGTGTINDCYIVIAQTQATHYNIFDRNLGSGAKSWIALHYIYYNGSTWELVEEGTSTGGGVTSVDASGGTGISVTGGPITNSGILHITNTAPDQVVTLGSGPGISVTGTYPNFNVANIAPSGSTVTPAALTTSGDTNITLDASGLTGVSLLQTVKIAVGWTGTLADARIASASVWNNKLNNGTNASASLVTLGSATPTANAIISIKNAAGPVGALISGSGSTNAVGLGSVGGGPYIQGYTAVAAGTANLILQPSGANVMIGTSTDGGEKLQVVGSVALDLGSDTSGDTYVRASTGALARVPIGSTGQILTVAGGLPTWATLQSSGVTSISGVAGLFSSGSPAVSIGIADIGVAGTYGSGTQVPVITTNNRGQVSNITTAAISGPISAYVVSNFLTSGTTSQDITGLAFAVMTNGIYQFDCMMSGSKATTNTGVRIGLSGPVGATCEIEVFGTTTANTAIISERLTTLVDGAQIYWSQVGTPSFIRLSGTVFNGANAGTVQFRIRTVSSNILVVFAGSWLVAHKLN